MSLTRYNYKTTGLTSSPKPRIMKEGSSEKISLLEYMYEQSGGLDTLLNLSNYLTTFAGGFWKNNKTFQNTVNTLRQGLPASMFVTKFFKIVKDYQEYLNSSTRDANSEKYVKIVSFLNPESVEQHEVTYNYVDFGKDVVDWLFQLPKTNSFHILGFYTIEKLEKVYDLFGIESGNILIPIEYAGKMFVWDFGFSKFSKEMHVHNTDVYGTNEDLRFLDDLKNAIFKEFMKHFDIKANVLFFNGGLHSRKRLNVEEDIDQYDIHAFADEIRKVLTRNKRRGYAFVGIPGVGKSSLIRKLESIITDYPFIYLSPNNFRNESDIISTFKTLSYMQPAIVIAEDLDSYSFDKKNERLGTFLNEIDDVNGNLRMALITTINDTNKVHYTLINRPGRLDQIILVKPPSTEEQVYKVLKTKYKKEHNLNKDIPSYFISFENIDKNLLNNIIRHKMTQADICEIIEKAIYIDLNLSNKVLLESLNSLIESKKAIKECNFKDNNPNESLDVYPSQCESTRVDPYNEDSEKCAQPYIEPIVKYSFDKEDGRV